MRIGSSSKSSPIVREFVCWLLVVVSLHVSARNPIKRELLGYGYASALAGLLTRK